MLHVRITDSDIGMGERIYLDRVSRDAARGVLYDDHARVALLYMANNGACKLPGGGLEGAETPEEAFRREIREETGYACGSLTLLGVVEEHKRCTGFLQRSTCFAACVGGQRENIQLTANEREIGLCLQWFKLENAIARMRGDLVNCSEYGLRFMLLRDATILEAAADARIIPQERL